MRDLELSVLRYILDKPSTLSELEVQSAQFFEPDVRTVVETVLALDEDGKKITPSSVSVAVGGAYKVTVKEALAHEPALPQEEAGRWLRLQYLKHTLDGKLAMAAAQVGNATCEETLVDVVTQLSDTISTRQGTGTVKHIMSVADEALNKLDEGEHRFLPSGFPSLDAKVHLFRPGCYSLVAARPSMGKTTLTRQLAYNLSENNSILYFTLEESKRGFTEKLLCTQAEVNYFHLDEEVDDPAVRDRLEAVKDSFGTYQFYVDDNPSATAAYIRHRARLMSNTRGLAGIFVDYITRISTDRGIDNPNIAISHLSKQLKNLARELDIFVCVISQLNRGGVSKKEKEPPRLENLRDSGSLEQDADVVLFLHSEDKIDLYRDVIIGKDRDGPCGTIRLKFKPTIGKFEEPGNE